MELTYYTHESGMIARYEQATDIVTWIYSYYAYFSDDGAQLDSVAALALNPSGDTLVAYMTEYSVTVWGS